MKKILVIDDEHSLREVICKYFDYKGYDVEEAIDGNSGLLAFQENNHDLIITDVFMPGKDGMEIIKEIRRFSQDVKIIIMTAQNALDESAFVKLAQNEGANQALIKPFQIDVLQKMVTTLLDD